MGLKVLMIGAYPYEQGKVVGGIEAVVSTLANSLAHSQEIDHLAIFDFFRGPQPAKSEKISDKMEVFHYPAQKRLALPTGGWLDYLKVKKYCQDFKPDVMHGQGIGFAGDLATRLGNSVVSVHGMFHLEARMRFAASAPNRWRIRLMERMVNRTLRQARVVISTSAYDFNSLKAHIAGRHVLIPNPVDASFFAHRPALPANQVVLFAGVMTRRKNVTGLVRAFAKVYQQLSAARLVMVGPSPDASYAQEVQSLVCQLGLQQAIEFRGFLENQELVKCLAQSRCLALFSDEETSPTIIAQAMAMGKPVVATRVGGIPELVQEGQGGFLVDAGNEDTFAERLVCILNSDDLVYEMGAFNHQAAVERCSPEEVSRHTIQAYHAAVLDSA